MVVVAQRLVLLGRTGEAIVERSVVVTYRVQSVM